MKYTIFALTFIFLSCSVKSNKDMKILDKTQLDNNTWLLKTIEGKTININLLNRQPFIELDASKRTVIGNDGCNEFGGKIDKLDNSKLVFGSIMSTEMACPNMDVSFAMGRLLGEVAGYQVKDENLYLLNKQNTVLMKFTKKDDEISSKTRLHDIWVLRKIKENSYDSKSVKKQPILEFNVANMKVMGNDGCNNISGKINELTDSKLIFEPLMGTKMACPNMVVGYAFNDMLEQVVAYKIKGLSLFLLDDNGSVLLEFGKVD